MNRPITDNNEIFSNKLYTQSTNQKLLKSQDLKKGGQKIWFVLEGMPCNLNFCQDLGTNEIQRMRLYTKIMHKIINLK